ncbi:Fur-regulated basic protein FbpA [Sporosarcina sp. ITBMC105]
MRKVEYPQLDDKRNKIIEQLVNDGIYKIHGKQLYELSYYELMKQFTTYTTGQMHLGGFD